MTREKWAKTGHLGIEWSERLDSNQRPLSPQNRPASYLIDLWCRLFRSVPAQFGKRSPVFGAIRGMEEI
jgi:hypothetical protein